MGDQTESFDIFTDGGYFQMAWTLVGANTNAPLTCAQAGVAGSIESLATDITNSSNAATDTFDCDAGSSVTDAFLAGTYTVTVTARGMDDVILGTSAAQTNKQVQAPNRVTNLGTITIPIAGH
jgi:hypothetical protein